MPAVHSASSPKPDHSRATTDAMYSLVQVASDHGRFGEGAAQSIILFAMVLAVTGWQFRSTGRRVTYQR